MHNGTTAQTSQTSVDCAILASNVSSLIISHLSRENLLVVSDEPVFIFLQPYAGPELAQGRPLACFIFHVSICHTCSILSRLIMGCVEGVISSACQPCPPGEKFLMKLRWRTSLQGSHGPFDTQCNLQILTSRVIITVTEKTYIAFHVGSNARRATNTGSHPGRRPVFAAHMFCCHLLDFKKNEHAGQDEYPAHTQTEAISFTRHDFEQGDLGHLWYERCTVLSMLLEEAIL